MIYSLIVQIFMAATLISGTIMLVFTIGYRNRLRHTERMGRYVLGILLLYSVTIRFILLLPGEFTRGEEASIIFDILYIALCIFYNFNIMRRSSRDGSDGKDKRNII